jgi:hypothetical protein
MSRGGSTAAGVATAAHGENLAVGVSGYGDTARGKLRRERWICSRTFISVLRPRRFGIVLKRISLHCC